jgi:hypothetical protein
VYRVSFSGNLKTLLAALTGGNLDLIEQNKDHPHLRSILQFMGSQMRALDHNSLIDSCRKEVELELYQHANKLTDNILVIYEDVRKLNEVDFIRTVGAMNRAFILLVERKHQDSLDAGWMTPLINNINEHETEREVEAIRWDRTIDNSQTLVYLKNQIGYISDYIKSILKINDYYTRSTESSALPTT